MPVEFKGKTQGKGNIIFTPDPLPPPPVANFEATPNVGEAPFTTQFTFTGEGDIASYKWNFEGIVSAESTEQNPTRTFDDPDRYTVSLVVEGPTGSDSETKLDYIEATSAPPLPPVIDFTATPNVGQVPLTVDFAYTGTGPVTEYEWDFESTSTVQSTQQNPTHTFTSAGFYTIKLDVSGPSGSDSETRVNFIEVTPVPSPPPQQFVTDWKLGGTASGNTGSGNFNWPNANNVLAENTAETSVTFSSGETFGTTRDSRRLLVTNFGFNIPLTATILGVEARIHRRGQNILPAAQASASVNDLEVRLWNGSNSTGTNQRKTGGGGNWISKNFKTETYGASNFLWGATLTPALINSTGFGVFFRARIFLFLQLRDNDSQGLVSATARVRWIQMRIHYQV